MGFLQNLSKALATRIGKVIGGDYKGASIGFGTKDTKTSISFSTQNEALIFFTKPEEYRFDSSDIESYSIQSSTLSTTNYEIIFKDGKKSMVQIDNKYKDKVDSALYK